MLEFKYVIDGELIGNYQVEFALEEYANNGRLAVSLWCFEDGSFAEPFCDVTTNIFAPIEDGKTCGYLDVNNMPDLDKWLIANGLGELTGRTAKSGFVTYPEFRFNLEAIKKHELRGEI